MEAPADEVVGNHNGPTTPTLKEKTEREPEGDLSPAESFSQCTLISSMDQPLKTPCAIMVPNVRALHEGSKLVGSVVLGRQLGAGMQARVFELVHHGGAPTGKVIKVAHTDFGHKALNAVWISMEREWELGMQLRAALQDDKGHLPGFMRVCDAIVTNEGRRTKFAGMILERLNGWEVYKRIDTPEFHNIHYVREMLRQVLTALDRAERETGFFHADLGQRNVMEHYPDLFEDEAVDQQRRAVEAEALGKEYHPQGDARKVAYETTPGAAPSGQGTRAPMDASPAPSGGEGSQHGTSPPRPVAGSGAVHVTVSSRVKPERIPTEAGERTIPSSPFAATAAGPYCLRPGHVRPRPGYSCNADGGRMPLGPRVEFKIIDYGSSIFSPTLAEATGGFRARKNYREMQKLFEADHVEFRSKSHRMINVSTAMRGDPNGGQDSWKLMPTRLKQRFAMTSVPKSKSFVDLERSSSADAPERLEAGHLGHLHASLSLGEERAKQAAAAQEAAATKPPKAPPQPRMGPIEKMYRQFWRRKGDVFHLLLGLALALDDRVWPKEDQEQVQLFATLIYHVTGVKLKASFAREDEPRATGLWGRMGWGKEDEDDNRPIHERYGARTRFKAWFRRHHIRFRAHVMPYNSGLTAGQALVSPFFQDRDEELRVAEPAAELETLFPRCDYKQTLEPDSSGQV